MASPDYYLCDRCGDKTPFRAFYPTGSTWNGVENAADGKLLDICGKCMFEYLKRRCNSSPYNEAYNQSEALIKFVTKK